MNILQFSLNTWLPNIEDKIQQMQTNKIKYNHMISFLTYDKGTVKIKLILRLVWMLGDHKKGMPKHEEYNFTFLEKIMLFLKTIL